MKFKRLKNQFSTDEVTSEVLFVNLDENRILLKAQWGDEQQNICFVSSGYFKEKYGKPAQDFMARVTSATKAVQRLCYDNR